MAQMGEIHHSPGRSSGEASPSAKGPLSVSMAPTNSHLRRKNKLGGPMNTDEMLMNM